jgi:hypothetical protein
MKSRLPTIVRTAIGWSTRWTGIIVPIALILSLARIPFPHRFSTTDSDPTESLIWLILSLMTIPVAAIVCLVAASIPVVSDRAKRSLRAKRLAAVVTVVGALILILCGAAVAMIGLLFSMDAPHAFAGNPMLGIAGVAIGAALVWAAVVAGKDARNNF